MRVALLLLLPATLSAQSGQWWPARGAVILGGGGLQEATANQFVDSILALAGGPNANIVIIPTASDGLPSRLPSAGPEPQRIKDLRAHFASRGAKNVSFLHTRDRQVANSEAFVQVLKTADVVFIPGGRSVVVDATYHGTLVERELKMLLARGGVLSGDSAGAIAMGCFWLGWRTTNSPFGVVSEGMCTMPNVTVSPHMSDDARMAPWVDSIAVYARAHRGTVPINIFENTFVIIHGDRVEVAGAGKADVAGERVPAGGVKVLR